MNQVISVKVLQKEKSNPDQIDIWYDDSYAWMQLHLDL